jgi:hypothetical protein
MANTLNMVECVTQKSIDQHVKRKIHINSVCNSLKEANDHSQIITLNM